MLRSSDYCPNGTPVEARAPNELHGVLSSRSLSVFVLFVILGILALLRRATNLASIAKPPRKQGLCVCFTKSRVFGSVFYKISFMIIIAVLFQFSPYNFMFNVRII